MSASAAEYYYVDRANQRQGPVSEAEIFRLAGDGSILADTLLWTNGMEDWRRADSLDRFAALFERTVVMPGPAARNVPPASAPAASPWPVQSPEPSGSARPEANPSWPTTGTPAASVGTGALVASLPIWGLFGRALLVVIGGILIIPSPWTNTIMYRFVCEHIAMPGGARLRFTGQPTDIWLVFMIMSATAWLRLIPYGGLLGVLISAALMVLVLRWLCAKMELDHGPLNLSFQGGILPYIGWYVLLMVSFVTIIGWAWVLRYMMRWICQNIRGSVGFEFEGTGLELLWRTLVVAICSIVLIPIPWLMRWYTNWFITQFRVVPTPG